MSVCQSLCPPARNNTAPKRRIIIKFYIWVFFEKKTVEKIQDALKSDQKEGYFTWRPIYVFDISLNSSCNGKCFRQEVVERNKKKTHFVFNYFFPRKSCCLWDNVEKNMVERDRPHVTMWLIICVCWVPKATNTYSEYVIFIAFPCNRCYTNAPQYYVYTYYIACFVYNQEEECLLRGTNWIFKCDLEWFSPLQR